MKLEKVKTSPNRVWYGVDEQRLDWLIENKEEDSGIIQKGNIQGGCHADLGWCSAFVVGSPLYRRHGIYNNAQDCGSVTIEYSGNTKVKEVFKTQGEAMGYVQSRILSVSQTIIEGGKTLVKLARKYQVK